MAPQMQAGGDAEGAHNMLNSANTISKALLDLPSRARPGPIVFFHTLSSKRCSNCPAGRAQALFHNPIRDHQSCSTCPAGRAPALSCNPIHYRQYAAQCAQVGAPGPCRIIPYSIARALLDLPSRARPTGPVLIQVYCVSVTLVRCECILEPAQPGEPRPHLDSELQRLCHTGIVVGVLQNLS